MTDQCGYVNIILSAYVVIGTQFKNYVVSKKLIVAFQKSKDCIIFNIQNKCFKICLTTQ